MSKSSDQKLPAEVAELNGGQGKIPSSVAISAALKDYENKNIVFSFEVYNQNQCEIAKLDKTEAKKLTKVLKRISSTLSKNLTDQSKSGVACQGLYKSKSDGYSALFEGLPEDVNVIEIDYSGAGRIFGYTIHNIFLVIAIGKKHR